MPPALPPTLQHHGRRLAAVGLAAVGLTAVDSVDHVDHATASGHPIYSVDHVDHAIMWTMWTMQLQAHTNSYGLLGVDQARGFVDNVDNVDHKLLSLDPYLLC